MGKALRHFAALMGKNCLLKRRRPFSTLLELLLPVAVAGLLAGVKSAIGPESMPTKAFTQWGSDIQKVGDLREAAWLLQVQRKKLAVIGPTAIVDSFVADMSARYPPVDGTTFGGGFNNSRLREVYIPGFADVVTTAFASENELEDWVHSAEYPGNDPFPADPRAKGRVWAAVVFKSGPPNWEYSLRFNASEVPSTRPPHVDTLTRSESGKWNIWKYCYANPLQSSDTPLGDGTFGDGSTPEKRAIPGFMALQLAVDRWIIDLPLAPSALSLGDYSGKLSNSLWNIMGQDSQMVWNEVWDQNGNVTGMTHDMARYGIGDLYAPHEVQIAPFPISAYTQQPFYQAAQYSTPFLFILALLLPLSRLIRDIVGEKEARLRESMRMMGMGDAALLASWLVTAQAQMLLSCLLVAAVLTRGGDPSAVFPGAGYGPVLLLFLLFTAASVMYAAFISVFFSSGRTASTLGSIAYLVTFFPFYGTGTMDSTVSRGGKLGACILPPTAFAMSMSHLMALEGAGSPLIITGPGANVHIPLRGFAFTDGIAMLCGSILLFALLAWYCDAILPYPLRQYGTPKPWYFPLEPLLALCARSKVHPCAADAGGAGHKGMLEVEGGRQCPSPCGTVTTNPFWGGKKEGTSASHAAAAAVVGGARTGGHSTTAGHDDGGHEGVTEAPDAYLRGKEAAGQCVQLKGMVKTFKGPDGREHRAVDGLDLTLYEGQITVLLGHNGAGKTTLINVVTGLLPADSGTASVFGKDLGTDFSAMREFIGACPQHDVLWPELTCMEHMRLFAEIKGIPQAEATLPALTRALEEVGLGSKVDAMSGTLSGGQKRKLSLAIALLGGPRIVLLDEPTSGMDPYSRRATWDMLRRNRAGRVIILTTHFMDEADILGDRIALMHAGRLHSCGTSMFLKQAYGVGYTLSVVLAPETTDVAEAARALTDVVQGHVPEASLSNTTGREVHYGLPMGASSAFPRLLATLEAVQAQGQGRTHPHQDGMPPSASTGTPAHARLSIDSFGLGVTTMEDVFLAVAGHGKAALGRVQDKGSDKGEDGVKALEDAPAPSSVRQAAYSPLATATAAAGEGEVMKPAPTTTAATTGPTAVPVRPAAPAPGVSLARAAHGRSTYCRQTYALLAKRVVFAKRDARGACLALLMPIVTVLLGLGLLNLGRILSGDQPPLRMSPTVQLNTDPQFPDGGPIYPNRVPVFNFKATDAYPEPSAELSAFVGAMDVGQPGVYDGDGGRLKLDPATMAAIPDPYHLLNPNQADGPHNDGWPGHAYAFMSSYLIARQEAVYRKGQAWDAAEAVPGAVYGSAGTSTLADTLVGTRDGGTVYGALVFLLNGTQFQSQQDRTASWLTSFITAVNSGAITGSGSSSSGSSRTGAFTSTIDPSSLNWDVPPHPSLTYGLVINTTSYHAAPMFANQASNSLYRLKLAADAARAAGQTLDATALPSLVAAATANGGSIGSITVNSHPLPYTMKEAASTSAFLSFGAAVIVTIGFAFVPAAHASYVAREKESGARQQQLLSGLSIPAYWTSIYLFDVACYLPSAAACILAAWGFGVQELMSTEEAGGGRAAAFIALVILYGCAVAPFAYLLSFAFKGSMAATTSVLMVSVFSVLLITASMFLSQVPLTCLIESKLRMFLLIFPGYALGNGMSKLVFLPSLPVIDAVCTIANVDKNADFAALARRKFQPLEVTVAGWNLVYLACQAVVYGLLVLLVDAYQSGALQAVLHSTLVKRSSKETGKDEKDGETKHHPALGGFVDEDADVTEERQKVDALVRRRKHAGQHQQQRGEEQVVLHRMRKVYPGAAKAPGDGTAAAGKGRGCCKAGGAKGKATPMPVAAVQDLSFAVPAGQVFGFLGINGAGKTTTMEMLTGRLAPTSGHAWLAGYDAVQERVQLAKSGMLGYTPQIDPLVGLLTPTEHLYLYGRLRGVPEAELGPLVQHVLTALDLLPFANKLAESLSGGNKRKLSVAIALIGSPPIVFLDEPSTGMDPVAKRAVWQAVREVTGQTGDGEAAAHAGAIGTTSSAGTSVILTTHSMEEAEALCTRIGIMVGGRLRCLGSAQHLKSQLGQGYQLQVQLAGPTEAQVAATAAEIAGILGQAAPGVEAPSTTGADKQEREGSAVVPVADTTSSAKPAAPDTAFISVEGAASAVTALLGAYSALLIHSAGHTSDPGTGPAGQTGAVSADGAAGTGSGGAGNGSKGTGKDGKAAVVDMNGWRPLATAAAVAAGAVVGGKPVLTRGASARNTSTTAAASAATSSSGAGSVVPLHELAAWVAQERQAVAVVQMLTEGKTVPWLDAAAVATTSTTAPVSIFTGGRVLERHGLSLRLHLAKGGLAQAQAARVPAAGEVGQAATAPAPPPLSLVFATLEAWRAVLCVSSYSLSESTLEQVFNSFAGAASASAPSSATPTPAGAAAAPAVRVVDETTGRTMSVSDGLTVRAPGAGPLGRRKNSRTGSSTA